MPVIRHMVPPPMLRILWHHLDTCYFDWTVEMLFNSGLFTQDLRSYTMSYGMAHFVLHPRGNCNVTFYSI